MLDSVRLSVVLLASVALIDQRWLALVVIDGVLGA